MTTPQTHDRRAIDTRLVLRVYAVLGTLGGLVLAFLLPRWLGISRPDPTAMIAAYLAGAVAIAAGLTAAGFARIDDPATRHRALFWFMLAHVVLLVMLGLPVVAAGRLPGPGNVSFYTLCAIVILLYYFWQTGDPYGSTPGFGQMRLTTEQLRSNYEARIREAAGQEERHRLARELHDSIKQQVFVMQTSAATAQARFDTDPDGAKAALGQLRDAARDAMTEMEAMLDNLRAAPLENMGLVEALRKQCEALGLRTGAQVRFEPGELPPSESLAPGAQQAIFRVAQEALANIGRHARARSVRVAIGRTNRHLALDIEDDGVGFAPATVSRGMGLRNMQARAAALNGDLTITGRPGGGAKVRLSVPCALPIAVHRRRVLVCTMLMGLFLVRVVGEVVLFRRLMTSWVDLMFLVVVGVILMREEVVYRRALERSKGPWLESPSRS